MLKIWQTKIFQLDISIWKLLCPSFSERLFSIWMSNIAYMPGPLHFAKCGRYVVCTACCMHQWQYQSCSRRHMTVPMFTHDTNLPLRSGWRSCSLAPQHPALTGLLTSRGGQCHCAMWSQCHSPFSSVSAAPSPVSSSSSSTDSPSISFFSFMSLDSVLSMAPSMSVLWCLGVKGDSYTLLYTLSKSEIIQQQ